MNYIEINFIEINYLILKKLIIWREKENFSKSGINYFVFYIILKVGKARISFNKRIILERMIFTSKSYIYF